MFDTLFDKSLSLFMMERVTEKKTNKPKERYFSMIQKKKNMKSVLNSLASWLFHTQTSSSIYMVSVEL